MSNHLSVILVCARLKLQRCNYVNAYDGGGMGGVHDAISLAWSEGYVKEKMFPRAFLKGEGNGCRAGYMNPTGCGSGGTKELGSLLVFCCNVATFSIGSLRRGSWPVQT